MPTRNPAFSFFRLRPNTPALFGVHPLWPQLRRGGQLTQGALRLLYETERLLAELTGMAEFTLQPLAGAHGELTGAMLIAAYHRDRGNAKKHILIPDSAHGTNPASAALAGFQVVAAPSTAQGTVDVEKLKGFINAETAGMMMTNPNTLGLFEPDVRRIADLIHAVDGLMYYDGANFNAIMGRCKPAEMGFDVCHLNPHKSFASPHGGGGPGAGPVGVVERLRPFLPISRVVKTRDGTYSLDYDYPKSIGYVAPFYGNFGVLVRTYAYLLLLGPRGPARRQRPRGAQCQLCAGQVEGYFPGYQRPLHARVRAERQVVSRRRGARHGHCQGTD